jgi:hypothetical protein
MSLGSRRTEPDELLAQPTYANNRAEGKPLRRPKASAATPSGLIQTRRIAYLGDVRVSVTTCATAWSPTSGEFVSGGTLGYVRSSGALAFVDDDLPLGYINHLNRVPVPEGLDRSIDVIRREQRLEHTCQLALRGKDRGAKVHRQEIRGRLCATQALAGCHDVRVSRLERAIRIPVATQVKNSLSRTAGGTAVDQEFSL